MIKVSIIIPVYNAEKTINSCLKSLIDQNYPKSKYEIICVNDGSTDNSLKIMESFQSQSIVPISIINKKNSGPSVARNKGANESKGEITIFTDSDCELDSNWIIEMTKPFVNNHIYGVQGCYMTKQEKFIALFDQLDIEARYNKMMKKDYIDSIGTYSAAYRREVFLNLGGFNTNYKVACGEDIEFSYLMANKGYKMVFAESAICYHKHPDTLVKYLKTKFSRGYWRTFLYKNYRDKIINDTYTSLIMKIQFVIILLFLLSLPTLLFNSRYLLIPSSFLVVFFTLQIHFFLFAIKKNFIVALVSPFIIFLRSIFFIAGTFVGFIHIFSGKLK